VESLCGSDFSAPSGQGKFTPPRAPPKGGIQLFSRSARSSKILRRRVPHMSLVAFRPQTVEASAATSYPSTGSGIRFFNNGT
jgi:hypothetical protein